MADKWLVPEEVPTKAGSLRCPQPSFSLPMTTSSTWRGTLPSSIKFEEVEEVVPKPKTTVATIKPQNVPVAAVPAETSPNSSQAESDGGDVRDGGGDGAVHDVGPSSNLQEMPRPVLREECSQEEFQSFTQLWNLYARYHSGMDVREL